MTDLYENPNIGIFVEGDKDVLAIELPEGGWDTIANVREVRAYKVHGIERIFPSIGEMRSWLEYRPAVVKMLHEAYKKRKTS